MQSSDGSPFITRFKTLFSAAGSLILRILARVFGQWQWQPPAWISWSGRQSSKAAVWSAANPKRASLVLVALLGLLPEVMRTTMRSLLIWQELVYGLVLILAVTFMPRGIWGFVTARRGRR